MGWKEKFCILSYKNMKSVLDFLDEWESTLPEGYKVNLKNIFCFVLFCKYLTF